MNKSMTAVIAVLVIIILVVIGLNYTGLLNVLNLNTGTNTNNNSNNSNSTSSNGNITYVVTSAEVSSSLGGNWTQSSSGYGTSGNVSSFFNVLSAGTAQTAVANPSYTGANSPQAVVAQQQSQPYENISSFEFSVYSPHNAGFAAVGYATFGLTTYANETFNMIYSNVTTSSYTNQSVSKGTVSGHQYVYAWNYLNNTTLTPSNQYESLLIGTYGNNIIGIFYLTPNNLSTSNFTNLYLAQISKMSNLTTPPALSIFVSASTVGNNIGNSWNESLGLDVKITNATSILHEFLGSAESSGNISKVDMNVLNQTVGNLSEIGLQGYTAGSMNVSAIGFAKFLNDKVSYLVYTTAEAAIGNNKNATTGTISSDNVSYVYLHESTTTSIFNMSQNSTSHNVSVLLANYGDYVIFLTYVGYNSVSQTQFVNLLKAEINVV